MLLKSSVVVAALIPLTLLATPAAHADHQEGPTNQQLLERCGVSADSCQFRPTGEPESHRGEYKLAGSAENCAPDKQNRWIEWSATEHTTNSLGLEVSAEMGFEEVFKLGVKGTYGREWGWSSTKTDKIQQEIGARSAVEVYAAPIQETVRGTFELHFGEPYYGHYHWYVRDVAFTGPSTSAWHTRTVPVEAEC